MVEQPGVAYAFFNCNANPQFIRAKITQLREHLRRKAEKTGEDIAIPRAVRFVLVDNLMKPRVKDDELATIIQAAQRENMGFRIKSTYSGNDNKTAAIETRVLSTNLHQTSLYAPGEPSSVVIIYKTGNHYTNIDSGKPFLPELMEVLPFDEKRDIRKLAKLLRRPMSEINSIMPPPDHHSREFFVVYLGERMVGSVALFAADDKTASIYELYVGSEFRGLGIGKRLVEYCEKIALEAGFGKLVSNTEKNNKRMQKILQGCSFRKVSEFSLGDSSIFVFEKILGQLSIPLQ